MSQSRVYTHIATASTQEVVEISRKNSLTNTIHYVQLFDLTPNKKLLIMTTIQYAEEWFKLHEIPTIVDDGSIYVKVDHDFELQLSTAEVEYRAELYKQYAGI